MLSNHTNSPKSQGGDSGGGTSTELKSIEATMTARTTSYESSCTPPAAQISVGSYGSYAANLSSPSIERVQEPSAPDDTMKRVFDTSSIDGSTGSTISPLDDEQTWTTSREISPSKPKVSSNDDAKEQMARDSAIDGAKEQMARDSAIDGGGGKVLVSAGWTLQLAETVCQMEDELEVALSTATEAGRNKAKAEDDLVKAQLRAEFESKRLRERLEGIIKEKLILEVQLESTQEDMKDKEQYYAREKRELQARVDVELAAIRTERRALLIRVDSLEEENRVLCGRLLAESGKHKKPGIFVALARELKRFGKKSKSFHPWLHKSSRGTQL